MTDKQWALVELYMWEHGELPTEKFVGSSYILALKKGIANIRKIQPFNIINVISVLTEDLHGRIPSKKWHKLNNAVNELNKLLERDNPLAPPAFNQALSILKLLLFICETHKITTPKKRDYHG